MKPDTKSMSEWLEERGIEVDVYCLLRSTIQPEKVNHAYSNCSRVAISRIDFEGCVFRCDHSTYKLLDLRKSKLEEALSGLNEKLQAAISIEERRALEVKKAILRDELHTIENITPFEFAQDHENECAKREKAKENKDFIDEQKKIQEEASRCEKEHYKREF